MLSQSYLSDTLFWEASRYTSDGLDLMLADQIRSIYSTAYYSTTSDRGTFLNDLYGKIPLSNTALVAPVMVFFVSLAHVKQSMVQL